MLTNREWATLFWLAVLLAFVLWRQDTRKSVASIVAQLFQPIILIPLLLFTAWMTGLVYLASQLGVWQTSMLKDTLFWSASGFALFFRAPGAAGDKGFLRGRLRDALGVGLLLGFYLNLATLDFIWEVILQFVLFLAVAISALGQWKPEAKPAKKVADVTLALIVLGLLIPPTVHLVSDWGMLDFGETLRAFFLPVWLTLFALPFIFGLMLFATYQEVFVRMGLGNPVPWRAKLALILGFRVNVHDLHRFAGNWPRDLAEAPSLREARRVIAEQRAALRAEEAVKQKEADDLVRYAGVAGSDAEGRQLDRREFKETADTLELLSSSQMGWFRQDTGYRRDLLEKFGSALVHGLPEDHGITLKVSRSGQSWYAWRRTPSGWCFAIGAAGSPPDQWFYDRPKPPEGYPGTDPAWGSQPFEQGPNWPI